MENFKDEMDKMKNKEKLGYLDSIVAEFNLNRNLCSKPSRHCQPSQRREYSMSEHMAHSHCVYIFNGMASKVHDFTYEDNFMHMSPKDMKEFYNQNLMYNLNPMELMESVLLDQFKGKEKELEVSVWRWNNKMAFCNYSERVAISLEETRQNTEMDIEELGKDLVKAIEIQKILKEELPIVFDKDISLTTRRILNRTRWDWRVMLEVAQKTLEEESKENTVQVDDEERETFE